MADPRPDSFILDLKEPLPALQLEDFEARTPAERHDILIKIIEQAATQSFETVKKQWSETDPKRSLTRSQADTMRTRLYLLSYLRNEDPPKRQPGDPLIEKTMRAAIRKFQKEAGLGDKRGWVDRETWDILQELVSFETQFQADRWLQAPGGLTAMEASPALQRAVTVRLAVLGFFNKRFSRLLKGSTVARKLEAFQKVARAIGMDKAFYDHGPLKHDPQLASIDQLFDQDVLVRHLADHCRRHGLESNPDFERPGHKRIGRLAACVARVELWLLGYEIDLRQNYAFQSKNAARAFQRPDDFETGQQDPENQSYYALYDFWRDSGLSHTQAVEKADRGLSADLFEQLQEIVAGQVETLREAPVDPELYRRVEAKPRIVQDIWEQIETLGSRMWDGVRRAWTWLKNRFRKSTRRLGSWVRNLARSLYLSGSRALQGMKQVVAGLHKSLSILLPGEIPGSQLPEFGLHLSWDLDLAVYTAGGEYNQKATALVGVFKDRIQDFGRGLRLLTQLLKALMTSLAVLSGAGWLPFIFALAKAYRTIRNSLAHQTIT